MTQPVVTVQVLESYLDARWPEDKGWLAVDELSDAPGFGARQRVDWAAIGVWGSNAFYLISAEIKVNRGDWLRELQNPRKNSEHMRESNEFWFVAPDAQVIDPKEVPDGCGLLLLRGDKLVAKVRPKPTRGEPSPALLTAFFKAVLRRRSEDRARARNFAELNGRQITVEDLRRLAKKLGLMEHQRWRRAGELLTDREERRREAEDWSRAVRAVRHLSETLVPWKVRRDRAATVQLIVDTCSTLHRIAGVGAATARLEESLREAGAALARLRDAAEEAVPETAEIA